jgi:hypothetical protein
MQRDRDVNRWGTPETVLPRAHPNASTDGDAAEDGRLTSKVSWRSGRNHGAGPPILCTKSKLMDVVRATTGTARARSRGSNYAIRRGMPIALPFAL